MKTIIAALLHLMGNPSTSAVLLAALIGSNAWMYNENRQIDRELSEVTAQLQRLADMEANALAEEQQRRELAEYDREARRKRGKDFSDRMLEKYRSLPKRVPTE